MSLGLPFCGIISPMGNIALHTCDSRISVKGAIGKLTHGQAGQWRIVRVIHATNGSPDLTHLDLSVVCPFISKCNFIDYF